MTSQPCVDRLAVALFERCHATGQPVTVRAAEELLGELLAHAPGCGCGLCEPAAKVGPRSVHRMASGWAAGIESAQRRARR